ncbi:MAG: LysR family transcriptional regulator, partial [Pseudomonadota bacterium]
RAMEDTLGGTVFARHARGLRLTELGEAILPAAQSMQIAANDIRTTVAASEANLSGTVRITSSINVSHYLLPPILARARALFPGVQLDLVASDDTENLLYGEADIAIRMYRPEQLELVTRYLGDIEIGVFAATSYLDRVGRPQSFEDVLALDLVGFDTEMRFIDGMRARGIPIDRAGFATRCDNALIQWELVRAGCGVSFQQRHVGKQATDVEEIELPMPIAGLPIWLTAPPAMLRTPRIRAIWELLVEELPAYLEAPATRSTPTERGAFSALLDGAGTQG